MKLLHDTYAECIVGGGPSININTSVSNAVGETTVTNSSSVSTKLKIVALPSVQSNLAVGVVAYGGVNSSFSASQAFAQVNDLAV